MMTTSISSLAAGEHVVDLRRVAERRRAIMTTSQLQVSTPETPTVVLRVAGDDDGHVVRDLAALDSAPALEGHVLLALIDGAPVAALSLRDERVVANPWVRTEAAVALLRLRAEHVSGTPARRRWPIILRPRLA
jgi:hypothetical protein